MISSNGRFTIVVLLLAATALFMHARSDGQFVPPRSPLASFPIKLNQWVGTEVPIPNETLRKLGPGEFLQRTYHDQTSEQSDVDLYIAYFREGTVLDQHLPQDCLAGSGWSTVEFGITSLPSPGDAPIRANRYLIAKGSERQVVLFWYSTQGRRDGHLVFDSFRFKRSDNALIRINAELRPGEEPRDAERRLISFAALVNPLSENYIPLQ